jgi:hypothetical protein
MVFGKVIFGDCLYLDVWLACKSLTPNKLLTANKERITPRVETSITVFEDQTTERVTHEGNFTDYPTY